VVALGGRQRRQRRRRRPLLHERAAHQAARRRRPERFELDLGATANRFLPGHRIRVEITSSWFPRFERNLNSGAANNHTDASPVTATQTIYHDAERASYVLLPLA
jgi:putative CocE/NonD family hydrolase